MVLVWNLGQDLHMKTNVLSYRYLYNIHFYSHYKIKKKIKRSHWMLTLLIPFKDKRQTCITMTGLTSFHRLSSVEQRNPFHLPLCEKERPTNTLLEKKKQTKKSCSIQTASVFSHCEWQVNRHWLSIIVTVLFGFVLASRKGRCYLSLDQGWS